ncbi:MAG: hypothetical protein DWQ04_32755 [Chloroflexi bacterium]|nr:MAG: hypothetical protein DWQ04_32755 [Chloroflexota bacterium]
MVMKHYYWLFIALSLALAGCRSPQFVNHSRPELNVDFSVFENVGCPIDRDENFYRKCEADSPMADLGCDQIKRINILGGLDPSYPIAECVVAPSSSEELHQIVDEGNYLDREGGLFPIFIRYVIFRDDQFELIGTRDEFKAVFAPVTSPEEALSYALVMKDLSAYFGLEYDSKYEYFVDEIEDSYVEEKAGGYLVHMYSYELFGCGPHITSAVDVEVTTDGDINKINSEAVYKDPSEDDLCVD